MKKAHLAALVILSASVPVATVAQSVDPLFVQIASGVYDDSAGDFAAFQVWQKSLIKSEPAVTFETFASRNERIAIFKWNASQALDPGPDYGMAADEGEDGETGERGAGYWTNLADEHPVAAPVGIVTAILGVLYATDNLGGGGSHTTINNVTAGGNANVGPGTQNNDNSKEADDDAEIR